MNPWKIMRNTGIVIGLVTFNWLPVNSVDADRTHLVGYLKWGYNGPSVTVSYSFGHKRW